MSAYFLLVFEYFSNVLHLPFSLDRVFLSSELCLESSRTSTMKLLAKIVNSFSQKIFIVDVRLGSKYASEVRWFYEEITTVTCHSKHRHTNKNKLILRNYRWNGEIFVHASLHKKWSFPLRIWSDLLKKSLMESFIVYAVYLWNVKNQIRFMSSLKNVL